MPKCCAPTELSTQVSLRRLDQIILHKSSHKMEVKENLLSNTEARSKLTNHVFHNY